MNSEPEEAGALLSALPQWLQTLVVLIGGLILLYLKVVAPWLSEQRTKREERRGTRTPPKPVVDVEAVRAEAERDITSRILLQETHAAVRTMALLVPKIVELQEGQERLTREQNETQRRTCDLLDEMHDETRRTADRTSARLDQLGRDMTSKLEQVQRDVIGVGIRRPTPSDGE